MLSIALPARSRIILSALHPSSSAQWRGLIDLLSTDHHALAPDLYGAGRSADWHSDREIALRNEMRFIDPVLGKAAEPLSLVGHSYGGEVSLMAALASPNRRHALFTEPTPSSAFAALQMPILT